MFRLSTFVTCILLTSPLSVLGGNLPTVFTPFTLTPSVEILQSPVSKVETISITPNVVKSFSPGGSAVAVAAAPVVSSVPVVQRIESYSSGDSSNSEIRDLLRTLLSELRSSKSSVTTLTTSEPSSSYGGPPPPPPSDSYGAPPSESYRNQPSDSYGAPPRNTFTDPGSPSYEDSKVRTQKPEKFVVVQERQPVQFFTTSGPSASAVAQIQSAPVSVRTVYQPIYVPYQYAPQAEYVTVSQPITKSVLTAVPTSIKTGVSAVAYSTVHHSPALAIQQQQVSLPVVQQVQQQYATLSSSNNVAILEESSNGGYNKK